MYVHQLESKLKNNRTGEVFILPVIEYKTELEFLTELDDLFKNNYLDGFEQFTQKELDLAYNVLLQYPKTYDLFYNDDSFSHYNTINIIDLDYTLKVHIVNTKTTIKPLKIKIKKLSPTAKIPTRGSAYAAGYDLYADIQEPIHIHSGKMYVIPTGIALELPHGYFAGIYPRSGLSTKNGLRLTNCVGVCDSDYRNQYHVPLYNDSLLTQTINPGDRIAQMIIQKHETIDFIETDTLSDTERGMGGFGSTGKN